MEVCGYLMHMEVLPSQNPHPLDGPLLLIQHAYLLDPYGISSGHSWKQYTITLMKGDHEGAHLHGLFLELKQSGAFLVKNISGRWMMNISLLATLRTK